MEAVLLWDEDREGWELCLSYYKGVFLEDVFENREEVLRFLEWKGGQDKTTPIYREVKFNTTPPDAQEWLRSKKPNGEMPKILWTRDGTNRWQGLVEDYFLFELRIGGIPAGGGKDHQVAWFPRRLDLKTTMGQGYVDLNKAFEACENWLNRTGYYAKDLEKVA